MSRTRCDDSDTATSRTSTPLRYQKVSEATGEIVPIEHIVKGFDMGGDHFVVIEDDDLKPLAPSKSKEIGVDAFVPADQISMTAFDANYIVMPGKVVKPYALLARALADTGRVAIGKFVMRQKEYLAVIRSDGRQLTLSTLVFPDELVDPATVEDLDTVRDVAAATRQHGQPPPRLPSGQRRRSRSRHEPSRSR